MKLASLETRLRVKYKHTMSELRKRVGAKTSARLWASILFSWQAATCVRRERRCCKMTRWVGGRRSISSCRHREGPCGEDNAVGREVGLNSLGPIADISVMVSP